MRHQAMDALESLRSGQGLAKALHVNKSVEPCGLFMVKVQIGFFCLLTSYTH